MTPSLRLNVVGLLVLAWMGLPLAACRKDGESSSASAAARGVGTPSVVTATIRAEPPTIAAPRLQETTRASVSTSADAEPRTGTAPLSVQFRGEVVGGPPGLQYCWDFGDGSPSACQLITRHTYDRPGQYTAQFNVSGPGVNDSQEVLVEVADAGFDVEADADPDIGTAPLTVQFSAAVDEDIPRPLSFQWDFGDGGRDASNPTVHTYRTPGTYTATLTVTNGVGRVARRAVEIQVDSREQDE
jgi:PKD repeat protein